MEKHEDDRMQDIGRSRRLLLKLLGMGSLAGAGVVSIAANASAAPGVAPAAAPIPNALSATGVNLHSYLAAQNVDAVVSFMRAAFGAVQTQRLTDDDGQTIHATLNIGGADMYVGKESPSMRFLSPASLGNFSAFVMLGVASADSAFSQAVAAGATVLQEPTNMPYGRRIACVADPFGQYWQINETLPASPTATATSTATATPKGAVN